LDVLYVRYRRSGGNTAVFQAARAPTTADISTNATNVKNALMRMHISRLFGSAAIADRRRDRIRGRLQSY
jgi:hypothetical protein